jgi:rhodanese-related sulfurtransferase
MMKPSSVPRWLAPLLILVLLALLLGGCSLFHRRRSPRPLYKKLSPPVAYEIMRDNPEMLVLDLRPAQEFNGETGHIRRARNIPLSRLPYRILEIIPFREDTVLVYCGSAGDCGDQGMKILLASGFESLILMDGGIEKWIREGFKTVLPASMAGKQDVGGAQPVKPVKPQKKNPDPEVPVTPPPPPPER